MISNVVILASCSFGAALFGLAAGLIASSSRQIGSATFPQTHVSFAPAMSDEERLRFLDEAAQAVRAGKLRPSILKSDKESREGYYQEGVKTGLVQGESRSTSSRNSRDQQ